MKNTLVILLAFTTTALSQPQVQVTDLNHVYSGARIYPQPLTVASITFSGSGGAQNAFHIERVTYSPFYVNLYGITSKTDRYNWPTTSMNGTPSRLSTLCEVRSGVTTCTDTYWPQSSEWPGWARGHYWERWDFDYVDYADPSFPIQKRLKYDSYQQLVIPGHTGLWKVRLAVNVSHYNPLNMQYTSPIPTQQGLQIGGNDYWANGQAQIDYALPSTSTPVARSIRVISSQSRNFTFHISIIGVYPR